MSGLNEAEHFRRIAEDAKFREWIARERESAIKYLTSATDMAVIHRAQGQMHLLEKMLGLLDAAKTLR